MRDANATYDPALNSPKPSQEEVSKAAFDVIQAFRREASAEDIDSPGELKAVEVLQVAIAKVPAAALVIVGHFQNTDNTVQDDAEMIAHVVTRQLGVYDGSTGTSEIASGADLNMG